jgi:hypothetical protein
MFQVLEKCKKIVFLLEIVNVVSIMFKNQALTQLNLS